MTSRDAERSGDARQQAIDELYGIDPDQFMARRAELVAAAKQSGAKELAKQITALRKPAKSAATLNRLARADPEAVAELVDLGEQLRGAERSVDARQIRDLTAQRRRLLDRLSRRAFELTGQDAPSSALRDEVVSTLTAALADGTIAGQLADGVLVKPATWEGFGFGGPPDLTLVAAPAQAVRPAPRSAVGAKGSKADREQARQAAAAAEQDRQALAAARAQQARRAALEQAQQAVDDAEETLILATDEEQSRLDRLRSLEEQVIDARRAVDEARVQLRRAEIRRRRAGDALRRLGG